MTNKLFLAVTYSEFQSVYLYGQIVVHRSRLSWIRADDCESMRTQPIETTRLFARFPCIGQNDEDGGLILRFGASTLSQDESVIEDPESIVLSFYSVDSVIPFTHGASATLRVRMDSLCISLSEPIFEKSYRHYRHQRVLRSSQFGAKCLHETYLETPTFSPRSAQKKSLDEALWQGDYSDAVTPVVKDALVAVFLYTRYDPPKLGGFDVLNDLGKAITTFCSSTTLESTSSTFIEKYRDIFKDTRESFGRENTPDFLDVISEPSFRSALDQLQHEFDDFLILHSLSLAIFLWWKDAFHRRKDSFEAWEMEENIHKLLSIAPSEIVSEAIWLFGSYLGHDRIVPILYAGIQNPPIVYNGLRSPVSRTNPNANANVTITGEQTGSDDVNYVHGTRDRESVPGEPASIGIEQSQPPPLSSPNERQLEATRVMAEGVDTTKDGSHLEFDTPEPEGRQQGLFIMSQETDKTNLERNLDQHLTDGQASQGSDAPNPESPTNLATPSKCNDTTEKVTKAETNDPCSPDTVDNRDVRPEVGAITAIADPSTPKIEPEIKSEVRARAKPKAKARAKAKSRSKPKPEVKSEDNTTRDRTADSSFNDPAGG